jgi:magnesium-transporting ATPase (P-type)
VAHPPGPYGYPGQYGYPMPWGAVPPRGPQRPGQVITAAVLAFVQAGVVLIASLYVWFFASIAGVAAAEAPGVYASSTVRALATEGTVLTLVQLVSVVLLVVAGIRALSARTRGAWLLLVLAHAVQVVLAVYWAVRLLMVMSDAPGPDPGGTFVPMTLFFAAGPLVGLGLVLIGAGRRWFEGARPA